MIIYTENPIRLKKLLELINEYSTVEGYKINIQKSPVILQSNNKLSERKMEEIIPSRIASKRIKYLEINLTMEVRGLYTKMYKTLMKKIEDTNK